MTVIPDVNEAIFQQTIQSLEISDSMASPNQKEDDQDLASFDLSKFDGKTFNNDDGLDDLASMVSIPQLDEAKNSMLNNGSKEKLEKEEPPIVLNKPKKLGASAKWAKKGFGAT